MAPANKKQKLVNGDAAAVKASNDVEEQTAKEEDEKQRRSLFVRSLPASTTSASLTDLFSDSYPVKHATAVTDPATKQCRGYGFVTFADAEDAQRARDEFDGHALEGRKLRIEVAEPRHRDSTAAAAATAADKPTTQPAKKPKTQEAPPQPSRLIVRNLPWTIKTPEQLSKLFLSYGKIKQAHIPKKGSGLMAGFGFVVLRGRKNAEKALEGINGREVDGRTLAVDWAVSKDVYEDLVNGQGEEEAGKAGDGEEDVDDEMEDGSDVESEDDEDAEEGSVDSEDEDVDVQVDGESEGNFDNTEERSTTVFIRNLPFTCMDEDLEDHFAAFGRTRYARVVMDSNTERSRGTGFVCFYNKDDAETCLRGAPKRTLPPNSSDSKEPKPAQMPHSILQNEESDPSGQYTMDGRVLQVSKAVDKSEADRLTEEGATHRRKSNQDKRRLYLLSEGTIPSNSNLWESLSPSERTMREASAKQRKTLIESNPSLHLSLTRLSIRNIPRSIDSKALKALAREAVVGFATDVKAGTRQPLSKEELARGGEEMQEAEKTRKKAGKGVVKQAKVVFEGAGGSKVSENSGAGRSRGYGFIEYYTHRSALMGLRWLNGHAIGYQVQDPKKPKASKEELQDRKKRLIVEFAIENAQVVMRRRDREQKARERAGDDDDDDQTKSKARGGNDSRKRKRGPDNVTPAKEKKKKVTASTVEPPKKKTDEKIAKRNQIIGRKRAMRRARKGSKA